jgi:RNA polymerase sigma-70 factor (ECF subfamily)
MTGKSTYQDDDNRAVLESMFKTFYPVLAAYCTKYVKDEETARDIIQDVFLKVWEHRHQVDFSIPLHSYLLKLAHNSCMNHLQRMKIEQKYQNDLAVQTLEMEMEYDHLFDQLVADDLQKRIDQVVNQLPAQCRDIFYKSRYEGMSHKDIAQDLNISIRTVETQIYRALKILKKALKEDLDNR